MDHDRRLDKSGEGTPDSKQNLVFIDAARNSRGVNNFLWRGSGDAPLIHRVVDCLFGLVLSVFGLFIIYMAREGSSSDRILSVIIGLSSLAGAVWEFRNACKRKSHWTSRS
jgi:hypothetical protein